MHVNNESKKIDLGLNIPAAYSLVQHEYVEELQADGYIFKHRTSGARVLYLAANDNNKVFSISFRTPPTDNTGVAHILEHSVLCGSRKFPLKEPFVELIKGSMNTFLNAMTFPDKTMYPVASKNDTDFRNLMDVYLDAVFYPRAISDPNTLMQEGWHYDINEKDAPLRYKGVVYNEMKGAYSSPNSILDRHMMEALFPHSTYGVDSGGDPAYITDLTFDGFVDFYHRYYHPSNSYIFLYGTMDIEDQLTFLDTSYLNDFTVIDPASEIELESTFLQPVTASFPYHVASDDTLVGKSMHGLTYVLPEGDMTLHLAFEVLTHALINSPAAPLKERLIKGGIGNDVTGDYMNSIRQPLFGITVTGSEIEKQDEFSSIVYETLKELCENGISKKSLEASLNSIEFILREADFSGRPIGLLYNIRLMDEWLYDKNPFDALRYEDALKALREGLSTSFYEDIIKKYILNNQHHALISIYPKLGLAEEKEKLEEEKLEAIKKNMSTKEVEELIRKCQELEEIQGRPDSEEALASIPLLSLSDLSTDVDVPNKEEALVENTKVHFVEAFTKGISYSKMYFHIDHLEEKELPYAYLLGDILGRLNTNTYTYADLANEVHFYLGDFSFSVGAVDTIRPDAPLSYIPLFSVTTKALQSNISHMIRLSHEVLQSSSYTDVKRLEELVLEIKAIWDADAFQKGHTLVTTRLLAQISELEKFNDYGALGYYQFIRTLVKEADYETVGKKLAHVATKIFTQENLEVLYIGERGHKDKYVHSLTQILPSWPKTSPKQDLLAINKTFVNEGITTSGQVQYVAQGGNYKAHGYSYTGTMKLLETILKYEFLWQRVRVQGGAYGAFATFKQSGEFILCSYRDPNLKKTLAIYKDIPSYIESLSLSERELQKYIIGTMSALDIPTTPYLSGVLAMNMYFKGIDGTYAKNIRERVIQTTLQDIQALGEVVKSVIDDNHISALGNEQVIKDAEELFTSIVPLSQ